MASRVRSVKEAQLRLSTQLRSEGKTWVEIAETFRNQYTVNSRVAFRVSRGWSQAEAAEQWNERWPDDPKTLKNFSYWEQWPAHTGYAPSLDVLGRLAELYECRVSDLVADHADHRNADPAHRSRAEVHRLPAVIEASVPHLAEGDPIGNETDSAADLATFVRRVEENDVNDLAQVAAAWVQHVQPSMDRRALLLKMGFALTLAASAPSGPVIPPTPSSTSGHPKLGGVWRSEYTYLSSGRKQEYSDTHYVVIRQTDQQLAVESARHSSGSKLRLDLTIDGLAATGTWEERTSPTGYYKGAIYRGAVQFLITPSMTHMTGKWLGFGRNFAINTGDWTLTLEDRSTSAKTLQGYDLRM